MTFLLVQGLAAVGLAVAVTCRVLEISRSAFYEWVRDEPSQRDSGDAHLTNTIGVMSRRSNGAPRVHAKLRLGLGVRVGRKPVARLMRQAGVVGTSHRRTRGTRVHRLPATHEGLVQHRFLAQHPDQPWATNTHRATPPPAEGSTAARSSTPIPG